MATGYRDFTNNGSTLRINYSYTQSAIGNTSSVVITSIEFKAGTYYGWYYADGVITIGGTDLTFENNASSAVNCASAGTFYTLRSNNLPSFTVTHDSSGNGSFSISFAPRSITVYNDFNIFCYRTTSGNFSLSRQTVAISLPQIDRTAPIVTITASAASTTSINISASSNVNCDIWQYKIDNGSWTQFSTTTGTSASTTVTGLSSASHTVQVRARKSSNNVYGSSSSASVDCTTPTVTFSLSEIGVYGFKISASANTSCDRWDYKIGDGSWTNFSTTSGTSASVTLNSLSPNTTYSVSVRARKASNNLYGTAAAQSVTTLGPSTLNSAATFAIDVFSPDVSINFTVYATMYHKLEIRKADDTLLVAHTIGQLEPTDTMETVLITAAEQATILSAMSTVKTLNAKICLVTYTDAQYQNSIGSSAVNNVAITTSAAQSAPTWSGFTYGDTVSEVVAVTGDAHVLVQYLSHLVVTAATATARNGASITGYTMNIGDISLQSSGTVLDAGVMSSYGNLTLTVTVMDSREYTVSASVVVQVLSYNYPTISQLLLRRRNEVDDIVQLSMSGSVPSIKPDSTELNAVEAVYFKYKKTSDDAYTTVDLTSAVTITGLSFSYTNTQLLSLDKTASFDFLFYVEDSFGDLTVFEYATILNQGTPIVSLRKRSTSNNRARVGINNPAPVHELDVHGNIAMHDKIVQGYVKDLADEYLSTIKDGGYYIQPDPSEATTQRGYPVAGKAGLLEVLAGGSLVLQRYTFFDLKSSYIRHFDGSSWSSWANGIISALDIYPVGAIYMSVNSTSPATLFGGTWQQIEDTFLLSAGQTYTAGDTGGEASHTLTTDELPSHTHGSKTLTGTLNPLAWASSATESGIVSGTQQHTDRVGNSGSNWGDRRYTINATHEHDSVGSDNSHNNMPPYLVVYVWKRTA